LAEGCSAVHLWKRYSTFITDLPSADKEKDEGNLLAHKAFFECNGCEKFKQRCKAECDDNRDDLHAWESSIFTNCNVLRTMQVPVNLFCTPSYWLKIII
jgi:hypothetical protein